MSRRTVLSWFALFGVAALTTAAVVTDAKQLDVRFVPDATHDLVVAGSADPGWTPAETDWDQGDPTAYRIALTPDGSTAQIGPGEVLRFRVAARHGVTDLPATVVLTVSDPDAQGDRTDPVTGTRAELFDQLRITVADAGVVLLDADPGAGAAALTHDWLDAWQPGETHLLDVTVSVPEDLGNAWQGATTDLQLTFVSESA